MKDLALNNRKANHLCPFRETREEFRSMPICSNTFADANKKNLKSTLHVKCHVYQCQLQVNRTFKEKQYIYGQMFSDVYADKDCAFYFKLYEEYFDRNYAIVNDIN